MRTVFVLFIVTTGICACATYNPPLATSTDRYYIVKSQDNFYSVAFAFEITVDQLKAANPWLSPSNIAPGMRLKIPGRGPGGQSPKKLQKVRFIWPLKRFEVSSEFGYRHGDFHAGLDLRAPRATRVYAAAAGSVIFSGRQNGYGRLVILDHGNGLQTVYAHNHRNLVSEGDIIRQGQLIASVGRSGNATGYHLHFEFRRRGKAVDPADFLPR